MIEIFGYGTAVAGLTLALFSPLLWIVPVLAEFVTKQVAQSDEYADRARRYFCHNVPNGENGSFGNEARILNRYILPRGLVLAVNLIGTATAAVMIIICTTYGFILARVDNIPFNFDMIGLIDVLSTLVAYPVGFCAVIFISYLVVLGLLRKGFAFIIKINKVLGEAGAGTPKD